VKKKYLKIVSKYHKWHCRDNGSRKNVPEAGTDNWKKNSLLTADSWSKLDVQPSAGKHQRVAGNHSEEIRHIITNINAATAADFIVYW